MKEVEIKGLLLKIGKKEITLTVEEAKKLHETLQEMFKTKVIKETIREEHHYHDYPYYPIWYWIPPAIPTYPITYCDNTQVSFDTETNLLSMSL